MKETSNGGKEGEVVEEEKDYYVRDALKRTVDRQRNSTVMQRAGSVMDGHRLRAKGQLKEQDKFIELIIDLHRTSPPLEVAEKVEGWVDEHRRRKGKGSTLKTLIPWIGRFFTPLPMAKALLEYDTFAQISRRRYVKPNFAEIRHILGLAQVHASAPELRLITFDADGTLYEDGQHFDRDNKTIDKIISLLQHGIEVAIVTAAGYPNEPKRFEARLQALLAAFKHLNLPREVVQRFHVMGGECNYLLRVTEDYGLKFVEPELWQTEDMLQWRVEEVETLLDAAEHSLKSTAEMLGMSFNVIRKERAVGITPQSLTSLSPVTYEKLEEITLTAQYALDGEFNIPFCAFNGGNDVFVDIGNKNIGLSALMKHLGVVSKETLHVGDRFTVTGNDSKVRECCSILWVANPEETSFFINVLLRDLRDKKKHRRQEKKAQEHNKARR